MVWKGLKKTRIGKFPVKRNTEEESDTSAFDTTCTSRQESITEKTRVAHHLSSVLSQQDILKSETTGTSSAESFEAFECIFGEDQFLEARDEASQNEARDDDLSRVSPVATRSCNCGLHVKHIPYIDPSEWPQAPVLLRPKPGGSTKILGIRKESSTEDFLWRPGQVEQWWDVLHKEWDPTYSRSDQFQRLSCEYCVILPINNGMEKPGEALVVDFETPLFAGTLLLRLRGTNGSTKAPYDDNYEAGYFADKIIRYQAVLRGRFKKELPFSSLVTGNRLYRPCGKLPPSIVMWATMKVIHFFAPQLNMRLEKCDRPYVLSPFGSAPRTIVVEDSHIDPGNSNGSLTRDLNEPTKAFQSILAKDNPIKNPLERARARKKHMDQSFISKSATPVTDPNKIYTFEFLQHLLDYQKFQIDVSHSVHTKLKDLLDGQPLQLMAECNMEAAEGSSIGSNELFSFEIWNECLWEDAKAHLES
jgi:Protein of unknown function (DUF1769)